MKERHLQFTIVHCILHMTVQSQLHQQLHQLLSLQAVSCAKNEHVVCKNEHVVYKNECAVCINDSALCTNSKICLRENFSIHVDNMANWKNSISFLSVFPWCQ